MLKTNDSHQIFAGSLPINELVSRFPTPFYLYSEEQLRKNIAHLRKCIQPYFSKFRIQYPVKANSNPHLLRIIQSEGLGADCSSPAEVEIARRTGFDMGLSTYTGNFESSSDLKTAMTSGIGMNLDDFRRLEELLQYGKPERISFRINPGIGRGGFEGIITGGTDAKFGIPYEETAEAFSHARKCGIRRFGIHMMTGSNVLEPLHFTEITQKLTTVAGEALSALGIQLEYINIGGGLGIPYTGQEREIDLDLTFRHVAEVFHDNVRKYNLGDPELVVEPGRYLVGNAGVLVAQVTHVKKSYRTYVGLNAGMSALLRPALYKAFHRILFDGKRTPGTNKFFITGQICENSDIHPLERLCPDLNAGDIAVILDCGAYGHVMSSNYNNRPRPAEVLVAGGEARLIRRADTFEEMFRSVPGFEQQRLETK